MEKFHTKIKYITQDFYSITNDKLTISEWLEQATFENDNPEYGKLLQRLDEENLTLPFNMDLQTFDDINQKSYSHVVYDFIESNYKEIKIKITEAFLLLSPYPARYWLDAIKLIELGMYRPAIMCLLASIDAIIATVNEW